MHAAVQTALLCAIAQSGSSATNGILGFVDNYGGGAPTPTPSTAMALAVDTSNQELWFWFSGAWHDSGMSFL